MNTNLLVTSLLASLIVTAAAPLSASAAECPHRLTYSDGTTLKNGSLLYYPNGQLIGNAGFVLYPSRHEGRNGIFMGDGQAFYPNGEVMANDVRSGGSVWYSTAYYPNGSLLSDGVRTYDTNGYPLWSGMSSVLQSPYSSGLPYGKASVRGQPNGRDLLVLELERLIQVRGGWNGDLVQLTRYVPSTGTIVFQMTAERFGYRLLVNMKPNGQFTCTWASAPRTQF